MSIKISGLSSIAQAATETVSSPLKVLMDFMAENYPEIMGSEGHVNQKKFLHVAKEFNEAKIAGKPQPTTADLDYGLKQIEADGLKFQRELKELTHSGKARLVANPTTTTVSPKTDGLKTQPKTTPITTTDLNVAARPGAKSTAPGLDSSADDIARSVKPKVATPAPSPTTPADPRIVTNTSVAVKPVGGTGASATVSNSKPNLTGGNQGKIPTPPPVPDQKPVIAKATTKISSLGEEITVITKKPTVTSAVVEGATEGSSVAVAKSLTASESGMATAVNTFKNVAINKVEPVLAKVAKAGKVLGPLGFALDGAKMIINVHNSENNKGQELFKYVTRTAGMVVGAKLGSTAAQVATIETGPGSLVAGAVGGAAGGIYGYIEGEEYGEESFEKLPKGVQDVFNGLGQGISDGFEAMVTAIENNSSPEVILAKVDALKETVSQLLPFVGKEEAARLTELTPDTAVSTQADDHNPDKALPQNKVKVYTGQEADTAEGRKSSI